MLHSINKLNLDPSEKPEIIKVDYHYCDKCRQNSIVDLSTAVFRYDDKKRMELAKENVFVKGMYIDKKTDDILARQLLLSLAQSVSLAN